MNARASLLALLALAVGAALLFHLFQRQLSRAWFAFGVHPDVVAALEGARDDQKRLAALDPPRAAAYRPRFEADQQLLRRLRVIAMSRDEIVRRYELALGAVVAAILGVTVAGSAWRQTRRARRLARLRAALAELARGGGAVTVGDRGRDLVGRIAAMVEETSRVMAHDRRRLASLENLSAWQEAARRHAHEIRTPLTAARLELARLRDLAAETPEPTAAELRRLHDSLAEELGRLATFTEGFTSFARLRRPRPELQDLAALAREFAGVFDTAWPELALEVTGATADCVAVVDPDMVRQVLANLADNSAHALREQGRRGTLSIAVVLAADSVALEVADDGPGIAEPLRARLFEPYTTSRRIGEGMGLGLAISRKILLDHGGDLELVASSAAGTRFRLAFPRRLHAEEVA